MIKGATSGFYHILHVGHLQSFQMAKELCDYLIVIVNNDKQLVAKSGCVMVEEKDRMELIGSIKYVDEVVLSIDEDGSVCRTIESIAPISAFYKGGDRFANNIPETEVCERLGIKLVDGLGAKIRASSDFLKRIRDSKNV